MKNNWIWWIIGIIIALFILIQLNVIQWDWFSNLFAVVGEDAVEVASSSGGGAVAP